MPKAVPKGYHTLTPTLTFKDARKAISFYEKALGAENTFLMPGPNGSVIHAEMKVGDSKFMLSEESGWNPHKSAETLGTSPVGFYLYVKDSDKAFHRAVDSGAKEIMGLQDSTWGDRIGQVEDPFGYQWTFATHTKDITPEEMQKGTEAMLAQLAGKSRNGGSH